MLTHVVIWKYRPDVDQDSRDEHLAELRSLAGVVEGMERLAVGFDILDCVDGGISRPCHTG